ncbi:hypothetical protein CW710_00725 [Candidatus Bathyarchaeota archaeon]|nr:MAG: hypothetical protein CW710_00725 [Candidatus Bathyarchaeota archaeon]
MNSSRSRLGRRSRLEILYLILKSCEKGASKTQITYDARINFKLSAQYLEMLERKNLVEQYLVEGRRIYRLTEKGRHLLHHLEEVVKLLDVKITPS